MLVIDTHIETKALTGLADECGDTGIVLAGDESCLIGLVDALGHGGAACEAAVIAQAYLKQNGQEPLARIISGLHESLRGTRGAVAGICRLDIDSGRLSYAGIGNISLLIFGNEKKRLVVRDGILGYMIPTPRESETQMMPGDFLVLHSDGIKDHIDPMEYPNLFSGTARDICMRFMTTLNKQTDDASCIVLRYAVV